MRIRVLVPSDDYLQQAGVRIRYRRVEQALAEAGHQLLFTDIREVNNLADLSADVVLISKCNDARASLIIGLLAATETHVGIDLFDDYFSQERDSRLTRLRRWLSEVSASIDFVMCSTPTMREVARRYVGETPIHVLNDPAPVMEVVQLEDQLHRKLGRVRATGVVDIAWFGMGDNPYFPVGLSDLCAFGDRLARLRGRGFDLRLDILTNTRALTAEALARLRALAIPHTITEWDPRREAALLRRSFAAFIPVSGQSFSIAKSLNRGLTALTSGNQIFSVGYPLYEPLADFVYRDGYALLSDIERGAPLLRPETTSALGDLIAEWGDGNAEAHGLLMFLQSLGKRLQKGRRRDAPLVALIHGKQTSGDLHKFAQRARALSVGSPYCDAKLNFDIRFRAGSDALECLISERLLDAYPAAFPDRPDGPAVNIDGIEYRLVAPRTAAEMPFAAATLTLTDDMTKLVASYSSVVAEIEMVLCHFFPGLLCLLSENTRLPTSVRWSNGLNVTEFTDV